jgi:hypothetical protein
VGEEYGKLLERVPGHTVGRILEKFDGERGAEPASPGMASRGRIVRAFGFEFLLESEDGIRVQRPSESKAIELSWIDMLKN